MTIKMSLKKKFTQFGQYFTTNHELKQKVFEFIQNEPTNILEPSFGRGDLIVFIKDKIPNVTFDMYEIDTNIQSLEQMEQIKEEPHNNVIYGDFLKQTIDEKKYKTIVGNPPFVRTKKGNLYIDFTEKCYQLLDDNGELIFIVPSDFFKLTSASKLLHIMMTNGTFTHIFHPHNEKMFENASIDVIVFRYCKDISIEKRVIYNDKLQYIINSNGLITFNDEKDKIEKGGALFQDYFDIYVGLVSGKDAVYKHETLGNINVLNGENKMEKYIYIEKYPCGVEEIDKYLLDHKKELMERKIRVFNEKNWFEWGAPRNINTINANLGKECIYIHNLTRKKNVCFLGKVGYFGGGLIVLIPKTKTNPTLTLENIVSYINSDTFKQNFLFSGRFKIGHRQICNSHIPSEFIL